MPVYVLCWFATRRTAVPTAEPKQRCQLKFGTKVGRVRANVRQNLAAEDAINAQLGCAVERCSRRE